MGSKMGLYLFRNRRLPSCTKVLKNFVCHSQNTVNALSALCNTRAFSVGNNLYANYEGDGKTTVTILNKLHKNIMMIDGYSSEGFRLNNGIFALGPIALFSKTVLHWNVATITDISPAALSLFSLLVPKLDILIFGTGENRQDLNSEALSHLKQKRINYEVLTTHHASETFNFLNAEGRCVAGAFLPPTTVTIYDSELKLITESNTYDIINQPDLAGSTKKK